MRFHFLTAAVLIGCTVPLSAADAPAAAPGPDEPILRQVQAALERNPSNTDAALALLRELPEQEAWPSRQWDLRLRLALQLVREAPPEAAAGLWEEHRAVLQRKGTDVVISEPAWDQVDGLIPWLNKSSLSPTRLLIDLQELPVDPASRRLAQARQRQRGVVRRSTTSAAPRTPAQADAARSLLAAHAQLAAGDPAGYAAIDTLLADPALPSGIADPARRWQLASLIDRFPLPVDEAARLLDGINTPAQRESVVTWNLCLRLLMRQVFAAAADRKPGVWREGIDRLRDVGDGKAVSAQTLADLDRFLQLPEAQRGVSAAQVLTDLMVLVPDAASMRGLSRRRSEQLAAGRDPVQAGRAAGLELLLSLGDDDALPAAMAYARGLATLRGIQVPALEAFSPRAAAPAPITFDPVLAAAARAALEAEAGFTDRRLAYLNLMAGDTAAAMEIAHRGLQWTAHDRAAARLDDLAVMLTALFADAAKATVFADLVAGASDEFSRLNHPAARRIMEDEADLRVQVSNLETGLAPAEPNLFGPAPADVRAAAARAWLAVQYERRMAWAAGALASGDTTTAVNCWADAIAHDHRDITDSALCQRIAAQLRKLKDSAAAAQTLETLAAAVTDPRRRAIVQLTRATFVYEQGLMDKTLTEIDAASAALKGVPHDQRMVAGLMRSVCQIKLGDLEAAADTLAGLEAAPISGDTESRAQVLFLSGWIGLNQNRTDRATGYFRRILDEYPGATYALKARELMQRLATADAPAPPQQ